MSGADGSPSTLVLYFADGTSTNNASFYAPDWLNGSQGLALETPALLNPVTGATNSPPARFFETTINLKSLLGAQNKPLAGLGFFKTAGAGTAIYAISGSLDIQRLR